ncbi:hypothetical protein RhiirA4_480629 [Rhizophagus irregularis]|uniref:Uncharacterized protein n=1 Tax=Rhizophagus irregularis TaxID=588596 RepID=A0A2I1HI98_9GLOM|nr:hypothetical protein RhiirA4_480629 [Rhizophagus irregularis]
MATLWSDRKPCEFLVQSGAHAFKIIQTSKGRRKLVAYFANWETMLMTLEAPPVILPSGKELKWCRHSIPNLKKAQSKLMTKKTPDKKKSGKTGNDSVSNKSKKKDKQQSSTKAPKNNNELKNLTIQKKAKKSPKNGGGGNKDNKEVLAEILSLLRRLV